MTREYILFFQLRCSKMIITRAFRSFIEMKNEEREENTNFILPFSNGFLLQKKKKKWKGKLIITACFHACVCVCVYVVYIG